MMSTLTLRHVHEKTRDAELVGIVIMQVDEVNHSIELALVTRSSPHAHDILGKSFEDAKVDTPEVGMDLLWGFARERSLVVGGAFIKVGREYNIWALANEKGTNASLTDVEHCAVRVEEW